MVVCWCSVCGDPAPGGIPGIFLASSFFSWRVPGGEFGDLDRGREGGRVERAIRSQKMEFPIYIARLTLIFLSLSIWRIIEIKKELESRTKKRRYCFPNFSGEKKFSSFLSLTASSDPFIPLSLFRFQLFPCGGIAIAVEITKRYFTSCIFWLINNQPKIQSIVLV